jgi:hypothetical protein
MVNPELTAAVERFAAAFSDVPDSGLETAWQWKGYDEGVRFSFFVTLLELRQLAVKLGRERTTGIKLPPLSSAQHILAQYHSAFMDLQAVIHGITAKQSMAVPGKKEWPVRTTYAHILSAEINFTAVIRYALANHRAGKWLPNPIPDKEFPKLTGMKEREFNALLVSSLSKLIAFHRKFHPEILKEFSDISNNELALPAAFWEETRFHVGYRLHRFEAHLRQHTIQIEKTLAATGAGPGENQRLIRVLFSALAEVNGLLILPDEKKNQESVELARTIDARTKEIKKVLV